MLKSHATSTSIIAMTMFVAQAALAQAADTAQPAPAAEAATEYSGIAGGDIVVTARKRAETIVSTPVSVTALNSEALADRGINNLQTLQDFTPGFKFQNQSVNRNDRAFNTMVIRGLYPGSDSSDRQVATVFLDGVPLHGGSIPGLTDIEQVEVVLGPQSAYFGRATFAGAVNFITKKVSQDFQGSVTAEIASYDRRDLRASVEGGITDTFALRVSARDFRTDGQYRNYGYNSRLGAQSTQSAALAFTFEPTSNFQMRGYATYWEDHDGSPASGQLYAPDFNCNPGGGVTFNYICGEIKNVPANRMTQNNEVGSAVIDALNKSSAAQILGGNFGNSFGLDRQAWITTLLANYEFDSGYTLAASIGLNSNKRQFITDTTFRDNRNVPNPRFGTPGGGVVPYRSISVLGQEWIRNESAELRLSSPTEQAFTFLVGLSYFNKKLETAADGYNDTGLFVITPAREELARTYGLFGSVSYDFGDFSASFEGRGQIDMLESNALAPGGLRLKDTFKSFTPRVIVQYTPTRNLNIYASYAEGVRAGEFNNALYSRPVAVQQQILAQVDAPIAVPEERLKMGEIGLKGQFFDNRLRLLTSFYYGVWKDKHIQQNVEFFFPTLTTANVIVANGEVRAQGMELQAAFQATENILIEGTYNLADTHITRTFCLECKQISGNANPVGNQLPKYSKHMASLSGTYTTEVSDDWDFFARSDLAYASRSYESEGNYAWNTPGVRVNARIGFRSEKYRVELFGTNIFDNKAPTSISRNTDALVGGNTLSVSPALRATYGVNLGVNF